MALGLWLHGTVSTVKLIRFNPGASAFAWGNRWAKRFWHSLLYQVISTLKWRRRWDSNPRDGFPSTPLAGERLRPLGHVSTCGFIYVTIQEQEGYDKKNTSGPNFYTPVQSLRLIPCDRDRCKLMFYARKYIAFQHDTLNLRAAYAANIFTT